LRGPIPRLYQGYTKAIPRLYQGYTKATLKPGIREGNGEHLASGLAH
jgi:hypothetical protein